MGKDKQSNAPHTVHVPAKLERLVEKFLTNRRKDVSDLTAALDAGDFDTVRIRGHDMKGVGRAYGFERITELGAALEQAALATDCRAARAGLEALADYLDAVRVRIAAK